MSFALKSFALTHFEVPLNVSKFSRVRHLLCGSEVGKSCSFMTISRRKSLRYVDSSKAQQWPDCPWSKSLANRYAKGVDKKGCKGSGKKLVAVLVEILRTILIHYSAQELTLMVGTAS